MSSPSLDDIYSRPWTGTVAPESEWKGNDPATVAESNSDTFSGFSSRCKVRIHGLDPCDPRELGHNETRWAVISLPTTGGSGISGEIQSHSVHSGDFVVGIWLRPDSKSPAIPVITSLIPTTRDLQELPNDPGTEACKKYTEIRQTGVPNSARTESGKLRTASVGGNASSPGREDNRKTESSQNVEIPCAGKTNAAAMQSTIQSAIDKINNLQAGVNKVSAEAIGAITSVAEDIEAELTRAADWLAGKISEMAKKILEKAVGIINKSSAVVGAIAPLNTRGTVRGAAQIAVEVAYCLFAKVLAALKSLLKNWLQSLVNTFFGIPLCVIENLLKNLIGQILGALLAILNNITSTLTSIIGSVTNFVNEILNFVRDLLELFNCDPDVLCPDTREWNIMEGGQASVTLVNLDINGIINGARDVVNTFKNAFSGLTLDSFDPLIHFDLTSGLAAAFAKCSGMPYVCGPPVVGFWGGGAIKHASATAVISPFSGGILSVTLTSGGFGYTSNPFVSIIDSCGLGHGAVAYAYTGPGGIVTSVVVASPGAGFTPAPSGAVGTPAGPIAIAPAIVVGPAVAGPPVGPGAPVLPPVVVVGAGSSGSATTGSTISLSPFSSRCMTLSSGIVVCPGFSTITASPVTFTVPDAGDRGDIDGFGDEFDVLLYLCDIQIINPGFGYSPDDELIITPSNGASAEIVVGSFGEITAINIINGGSGFTDIPTITIQSSTGFNAELLPRLCSTRIEGFDPDTGGGLPADIDPNSVLHVVDCVGKVVAPV